MKDKRFLALLARASAVAIVERHAPDVRNREALIEGIARLVLIGLEGHVRLYAMERSKEMTCDVSGAENQESNE